MNNGLKRIYDALPGSVQSLLITGFSMKLDYERYGGNYAEFKKLMRHMEAATDSELSDYQDEHLSKLIDHSYESVPYYRRIFHRLGLKPKDVRCRSDLAKLPLLTKEDIKSNFDDLRSTAFSRKSLKMGHTSGTTGTPLEVLYDPRMITMNYAAMDRQYRWAGINFGRFGDKVAVIRGNVIVPLEQSHPPFWRFNWYHNQMLLSNFHLTIANIPEYFKAIRRFSPKVLDGYPSSVYVLAKVLLNNNDRLPLHAVATSSETLYDHQRKAIEQAFQCRVFDYYGAAERVIFAAECESHNGHHLLPEYGITEFLGEDLQAVPPGVEGTMVGTSLHNYGMPLIRYVSNDRTSVKIQRCKCGRSFPLIEDVSTKAEDMLRLPDGRLISPSVLTHPFKPLNSINGSQIIQTDLDRIIVRLIPRNDFTDSHATQLLKDLKTRLGKDMRIDMEYVDELPRTKSGKFKWVISNVDLGV